MAIPETEARKYKKNRAPRNSKPLAPFKSNEPSHLGSREAFCKRVEHIWNTHSAADIQKIMNSPAKLARMRGSDAAIFMRMKQAQTDNGIADMKLLLEYMIGKPAQEINSTQTTIVKVSIEEAARRIAFMFANLPQGAAPVTLEQLPTMPVLPHAIVPATQE